MATSPLLKVRPVHRIAGSILMLFTLWLGATGLWIQYADLHALLRHAAATDPEMLAIRESVNGTGNFSILNAPEYMAPALPDGLDLRSAMATLLKSARAAAGAATPVKYLEIRMFNGQPIGRAQADRRLIRVDVANGEVLPGLPKEPERHGPMPSMHATAKRWHRMAVLPSYWGDLTHVINALVGLGLFVLIVTGLVLYFQVLRSRRKAGLNAMFWFSGGAWRSLHRGVSVVAAIFLLVVSTSGALLSIDTVALGVYGFTHRHAKQYSRFPWGMQADLSSPVPDAKVSSMLETTLAAYRAAEGSTPIKVIRLRYFSGMPQGVVLTGGAKETRQLVFNAETGNVAHMTEPSYPFTGMPFGWEEHEYMKQIHRGDALGIPGRLLDVFAGLSLVFLSASGMYMYFDLLRRRRKGGRTQMFWS